MRLLCPFLHFKVMPDDSVIQFCISVRLRYKQMNISVLHVSALKVPSGAALMEGVFSFLKTQRIRTAAEKLFSRENLISFNGQQAKKLTKRITNLISFGQIISATWRISIFWCSQMSMILLHSEPV